MASRSPLCLIASRLTRPWLVQQARWCPHLSCLSLRGVSTSTTASAASAEPTTSPSLQEIEWPRWQPSSRRTGLIALKRGMTSFIDEWGVVHACTVLQVSLGPATERERTLTRQYRWTNAKSSRSIHLMIRTITDSRLAARPPKKNT